MASTEIKPKIHAVLCALTSGQFDVENATAAIMVEVQAAVTAEVERAVQPFAADIQRKVDLEYRAGGRYPGHIIEPWADVIRPIINKAALHPQPQKGKES